MSHFDTLDLKNWEVEEAIPTSDLIWSDINKHTRFNFLIRFFLSVTIPFGITAGFIYALTLMDLSIKEKSVDLMDFGYLILKYLSPLLLLTFTFYAIPHLVYSISLRSEFHERKSAKESSFMSKNIIFMTLSLLLLPFISTYLIKYQSYMELQSGYFE